EFTKRKNWPQKIICGLKDIYYVITNSSRFIYCSPSCQELTGYSPEELVGRNISDFIHVDDIDTFIRDLNCGATKRTFSLFYRFRKKDDKFIMLEVQCRPYLADNSPIPACFFCNARQYPSKASSLLDTFLEMKIENELLRRRLKEHGRFSEENGTPSTSSTGDESSNVGPSTPLDGQSIPSKKYKSEDEKDHACTECGTTKSPEWRRGPQGPKTLCNACGLRWAKKSK
ncbi:hypothetical protein K493DRAFT_159907, partial [Basidiobolus meristosporus CBS 931.73]